MFNYYTNTIIPIAQREQYNEQLNISSYDYEYDYIFFDSIEKYNSINKEGAISANPLDQEETTSYYQLITGDYNSEVEAITPMAITSNVNVATSKYFYDTSHFNQLNFAPFFGDNSYLEKYSYNLIAGTLSDNEKEVVIDSLSAQMYFDTANYGDIIGKNISLTYMNTVTNQKYPYILKVVGVYEYEPFDDIIFYPSYNYLDAPFYDINYTISVFTEKFLMYHPIFLIKLPPWETYAYKEEFIKHYNIDNSFYGKVIFPKNSGITGVNTISEYPVFPTIGLVVIATGFIQITVAMIILFFINYKHIKNKIHYLSELIIIIPLLIIFSYSFIYPLNEELVPVSIFSYLCALLPILIVIIIFSFCYYKSVHKK